MAIVGLRRLRIAPLILDSADLLLYGDERVLAKRAVFVSHETIAGVNSYNLDGSVVSVTHGAIGDVVLRFAEPDEDALAFVLSEGALFGLGFEAVGIGGAPCERTWFRKCSARSGAFERGALVSGVKEGLTEIIVSVLATTHRAL